MRRTLSAAGLLLVLALALVCPSTAPAQVAGTYYSIPTFVAAGAVASNANAISPGLPAGLRWGDILILACETENQAITIASANGGTWTEIVNVGTGTGSDTAAARITVFWSRYNVSQGAPTTSDSGDHQLCRMIAVRGATFDGSPIDVVSAGSTEVTSDTSWVVAGATSTAPNTMVVIVGAGSLPDAAGTAEFSGHANTDLYDIQERTDNSVTAGTGGSLTISTAIKKTAGTWGDTTITSANNASKAMSSFAIRGVYHDEASPRTIQTRALSGTATDPAASIALAYLSNTTAGNLLVAAVTWGDTDGTPTAADTQLNSWSEVITHCWDGTANQGLALFYAQNTAGGANTVTITLPASVSFRSLLIAEYSHAATSGALEDSASQCTQTATAAAGAAWAGHVNTTTAHSLILSAWNDTSSATITHYGAYRVVSEEPGNYIEIDHFVALQVTQYNGQATATVSVTHGIVAAFKVASGAAASVMRRLLFGVGP